MPLDVRADDFRFAGIKLTADSIYAVITDLRAEILDSETVPVPSFEVPEVVGACDQVLERLLARTDRDLSALGVTVGGPVDKGETVADSPFLHWHGVPFRTLIAQTVDVPVHLANDVAGLTMAQQWFGHGREFPDFALLTVGAGVGYGLVINEEPVPTSVSPISHFPIDRYGPLCPSGHRGCMSSYVTTQAIVSAVSTGKGRELSHADALRLAENGDPLARRVIDEAAYALGCAVGAVTSLTGVNRIILSGEGVRLAEIGEKALRDGRTAYDTGRSPSAPEPVIRPMDFLEWARGAAVIAVRAEFPGR